ncbi:unnamed protein product [Dovyalis caffra]|uniref:Uncharacterized protein n=1 Tax=Dovyalis caffra TaxID=77055 RepID=A0AAV1QZJ5_9ROSI|nr:unnamed protein product [Dovyalis caffra]
MAVQSEAILAEEVDLRDLKLNLTFGIGEGRMREVRSYCFIRYKCQACRDEGWKSWSLLPEDEYCIPKDIPKGHLAVYVGEDCKRYVIKVTLLKHPLFKALLDRTEEVFGFTTGSKLCIPCNESMFKTILHCINSQQDH